jgi:micrococcal nuclease
VRRRSRAWRTLFAAWSGLVVLVVALTGCEGFPPETPSGSTSPLPAGALPAETLRVVDGDTIVVELDGREERVRYIGIDTPESVKPNSPVECFGPEASDANAQLVDGQTVYLVRDVSDRDRFGRLLRYVYVAAPGIDELVFVNLVLVEGGYAQVSTYPPDVRHSQDFLDAQVRARSDQQGLWSACR